MKKIMGGVAALAVAGGIAVAAPAHAKYTIVGDEDDYSGKNYAAELAALGLPGVNAGDAASYARRICLRRMAGTTEDQLIDEAIDARKRALGPPTTVHQAEAPIDQGVGMVMAAEYHFCHDYDAGGQETPLP
jgi:hypothetical protein